MKVNTEYTIGEDIVVKVENVAGFDVFIDKATREKYFFVKNGELVFVQEPVLDEGAYGTTFEGIKITEAKDWK